MIQSKKTHEVLMVAYEYAPCQSAGVQRTLKFTEFLPRFNWHPTVLTVKKYAYQNIDDNLVYPSEVDVVRAHGLDASRHLSIKGKYFGFTSIPDRYSSWVPHATLKGKHIIKRKSPDVLWSTFPFFSSHLVARKLKEFSRLPWVADFRDPAGFHYHHGQYNDFSRKVDQLTVEHADRLVFATEAMRGLYCDKYSFLDPSKTRVIENGFNSEAISKLTSESVRTTEKSPSNKFVLLHSGAIYPNGRDPRPIIQALGILKDNQPELADKLLVRFRSAQCLPEYQLTIDNYRVDGMVEFCEAVSYEESIREMLSVDCLLLVQGKLFNYQIPGKAYEYLATNQPVMCVAHPEGATAKLFRNQDAVEVAADDDPSSIYEGLKSLIEFLISEKSVNRKLTQHSRETKSKELSEVLNDILV